MTWYWLVLSGTGLIKGFYASIYCKKLMVTSTNRPTNRQGEYRAICLFRKLENRKKAEICNNKLQHVQKQAYEKCQTRLNEKSHRLLKIALKAFQWYKIILNSPFSCASGRSKFGVLIIITHWSIKIRLLRKLAKPNCYVTVFGTPCIWGTDS